MLLTVGVPADWGLLLLIVDVADRYVNYRCFPDKAIDLLDEVGAKVKLKNYQIPESIKILEKKIEEVKAKKKEAKKDLIWIHNKITKPLQIKIFCFDEYQIKGYIRGRGPTSLW